MTPRVPFLLFVLFVGNLLGTRAFAEMYFIDYEEGNDSRDGLTHQTAWKHCPGMQTAAAKAGEHKIQVGDVFVFKGGSVWLHTVEDPMFPLVVSQKGGKAAPIVYKNDSAWCKTANAKPVLDGGLIAKVLVSFADQMENSRIAGFEMRHHVGDGSVTHQAILFNLRCRNISVADCYIHDWKSPKAGNQCGIGFGYGSADIVIDGCVFNGAENGVGDQIGACLYASASSVEVKNCKFYNLPNAILGAGKIHHNLFFNMTEYWNDKHDGNSHYNPIEVFDDSEVYNNVIYDINSGGVVVYLSAAFNEVNKNTGDIKPERNHTVLFYNNLVYGTRQPPLLLDGRGTATYKIYNNTLIYKDGAPIRMVGRGAGSKESHCQTIIDLKNNLLINENKTVSIGGCALNVPPALRQMYANTKYTSDYNCYVIAKSNPRPVYLNVEGTPVTLAQSKSLGNDAHSMEFGDRKEAGLDEQYRPMNGSPLAGKGANLRAQISIDLGDMPRPESAPWDIGAYQKAQNK